MRRPTAGTLILGHRGSPLEAPENTMAGFALALAAGADGVELDVQRSLDRVPVVMHDASLTRTGHGRGPLAGRSWAELAELRGRGEPIPSLDQVARWAGEEDAWLNVEIKATDVTEETLEVLRSARVRERVIVSSFHPGVVADVARLDPSFARYLLLEEWSDAARDTLAGVRAQGVCLRVDAADAAALAALEAAGIPVIVWTVDDPDRIAGLLRARVAGIITNTPGVAATIRG